MTNQEAIQKLKDFGYAFQMLNLEEGVIGASIKALEKQIPKLAEFIVPFEKFKCPSCGEMYDACYDDETGEPKVWFNYCPECGQAIISREEAEKKLAKLEGGVI